MEKLETVDLLDNVHELLSLHEAFGEKHTILIVDDEENNLQLLKRSLRRDYTVLTASNGLEALNLVDTVGKEISMIISDQRMPEMQGVEFLEKVSEEYPDIIKILLTGYTDTDVIIDAINKCNLYQYILKPFDPNTLQITVQQGIKKFEILTQNTELSKDLNELFYKTIKAISSALDAKDPYTHGHSYRVTLYSMILAKKLNSTDEFMEEIETAGLLHDIGKIGIPQSILCKPGKLTDEEYAIMKKHPEQGEKMIMDVKQLSIIADWLRSHHERWDGRGYPAGLKGEEIPLSARIIALADTYDAMTSTRSYRKALSHEEAIAEIERCSGTQFDPNLAKLFIENQEEMRKAQQNPDEYYQKYSYLERKFQ